MTTQVLPLFSLCINDHVMTNAVSEKIFLRELWEVLVCGRFFSEGTPQKCQDFEPDLPKNG